IMSANSGAVLPNLVITPVHRADSSGTTFIFTEYLAKTSSTWKEKIGLGKSVNWPAGSIGQKGNPGVAGYVKQTPGAIGYVELLYATQNKMAYGNVKNKAGKFIEPALKSVTAAADVKIPDDTNISLTNTDAAAGYPISSFTWLIFYKEQNYGGKTKERAEALAKLLMWMVGNGQRYLEPLQYAPLSKEAAARSVKIIRSMTYNGMPLLK
ncbi:MAG: pstS, partial [Deltaproteobacteria bacterium]|nr:pstS [Deltaproteobacteria bacterium]